MAFITPPPEFSVWRCLCATFEIMAARKGIFLALAFLSLIPGSIIELLVGGGLISRSVSAISVMLAQGAASIAVAEMMARRDTDAPSLGGALSAACDRLLSLCGIAIILTVAMAVPLALMFVLRSPLIAIIAALVIFVAVAARCYLCVAACAAEGLGPVDSIRRSADLSSGNGFGIVVYAALVFAGCAVFSWLTSALLMFIAFVCLRSLILNAIVFSICLFFVFYLSNLLPAAFVLAAAPVAYVSLVPEGPSEPRKPEEPPSDGPHPPGPRPGGAVLLSGRRGG